MATIFSKSKLNKLSPIFCFGIKINPSNSPFPACGEKDRMGEKIFYDENFSLNFI
jgi:hypothetical protein